MTSNTTGPQPAKPDWFSRILVIGFVLWLMAGLSDCSGGNYNGDGGGSCTQIGGAEWGDC